MKTTTKISMSPEAILRRLNDLNQLWSLCVTLSTARRTGKREGMIKMKELADRPKDRIDLEFLRGENDES